MEPCYTFLHRVIPGGYLVTFRDTEQLISCDMLLALVILGFHQSCDQN